MYPAFAHRQYQYQYRDDEEEDDDDVSFFFSGGHRRGALRDDAWTR